MFSDELTTILAAQHGVMSRKQALANGVTASRIRAQVDAGRWQMIHLGVIGTFTGPLPYPARLWAAVLSSGPGSVLSHQSAAVLLGLLEQDSEPLVHVTVPSTRRVVPAEGVRRHYSSRISSRQHPLRQPPQTRAEATVIDLAESSTRLDDAIGWLAKAVARRVTTADRLAAEITARAKLRHRRALEAALADVAAGCHSVLEIRYLRTVESAHGLPVAHRQSARRRRGGRLYEDVRYREFSVVVELDGRLAHPDDTRFRDMRRDNAASANGSVTLRYGFGDVHQNPCRVAAQVAEVLIRAGWRGRPRPCGPRCGMLSMIL